MPKDTETRPTRPRLPLGDSNDPKTWAMADESGRWRSPGGHSIAQPDVPAPAAAPTPQPSSTSFRLSIAQSPLLSGEATQKEPEDLIRVFLKARKHQYAQLLLAGVLARARAEGVRLLLRERASRLVELEAIITAAAQLDQALANSDGASELRVQLSGALKVFAGLLQHERTLHELLRKRMEYEPERQSTQQLLFLLQQHGMLRRERAELIKGVDSVVHHRLQALHREREDVTVQRDARTGDPRGTLFSLLPQGKKEQLERTADLDGHIAQLESSRDRLLQRRDALTAQISALAPALREGGIDPDASAAEQDGLLDAIRADEETLMAAIRTQAAATQQAERTFGLAFTAFCHRCNALVESDGAVAALFEQISSLVHAVLHSFPQLRPQSAGADAPEPSISSVFSDDPEQLFLALDKCPTGTSRRYVKDATGQWLAHIAREIEEHPMAPPVELAQLIHSSALSFVQQLVADELRLLPWAEELFPGP
jgi:hypothetical protein